MQREIGILYTPENIRAIAEKRKWQTRRVIVPQPESTEMCPVRVYKDAASPSGYSFVSDMIGTVHVKPRYRVTDILYPKEAWQMKGHGVGYPGTGKISDIRKVVNVSYKMTGDEWYSLYLSKDDHAKALDWWRKHRTGEWKSPLYMPKWVARPELKRRVTDVRVERVQDISEEDAIAEGVFAQIEYGECNCRQAFHNLWDSISAKPKPVREKGVLTHYVSYPWQDIHETRKRRGKPWYVCGNPFVFVYSFEEIESGPRFGVTVPFVKD